MERQQLLDNLYQEFNHGIMHLVTALEKFPWEDQKTYASWCSQTFYLVQHTTRYLCYTASQFSFEHQEYHNFCLNHLREETGHELLAKADMEYLGYSLKDFPPTIAAATMIQSQYDWIKKSPFSHFGFFWVLENLSVKYGKQAITRVKGEHGPECLQFLNLHAEEDMRHIVQIHEKVEKIPTDHLSNLTENIKQTANLYVQMLNTLAKTHSLKQAA